MCWENFFLSPNLSLQAGLCVALLTTRLLLFATYSLFVCGLGSATVVFLVVVAGLTVGVAAFHRLRQGGRKMVQLQRQGCTMGENGNIHDKNR